MSNTLYIVKRLVAIVLVAVIACLALSARAELMRVACVQACGGLRVRDAPTTEAKVTYLLDDTTTVVVLDEKDGWCRVAFNTPPHAELGWAKGDYLK